MRQGPLASSEACSEEVWQGSTHDMLCAACLPASIQNSVPPTGLPALWAAASSLYTIWKRALRLPTGRICSGAVLGAPLSRAPGTGQLAVPRPLLHAQQHRQRRLTLHQDSPPQTPPPAAVCPAGPLRPAVRAAAGARHQTCSRRSMPTRHLAWRGMGGCRGMAWGKAGRGRVRSVWGAGHVAGWGPQAPQLATGVRLQSQLRGDGGSAGSRCPRLRGWIGGMCEEGGSDAVWD